MKLRAFFILLCLTLGSIQAEEFRPNLGPDLPSITVTAGKITLLLRRNTQWTPGRIDYDGSAMTTERSAYGTVFSFPDVGFIGTGHLENEPENLQSLAFSLDGKELNTPAAELSGETFRFERKSLIRNIALGNIIEIRNNRLYETAVVSSPYETPLKLVYHFMHAWTPTVSAYLAGIDETSQVMSSALTNDEAVHRQFHIETAVDWVAVYEPVSGQFAVSRLLESPPELKTTSKIWNVIGTYRKYYLQSAHNDTLPAGFHGTWRMVTAFGNARLDEWEREAGKLAIDLLED